MKRYMLSNCLHVCKACNPTKVVVRESIKKKRKGEEATIKELFQHIFGREKANEKVIISKNRKSYNSHDKRVGGQEK